MYHVTMRGNHQQDIFFCPADRDRLSELFANTIERLEARLHAYCYMTNHFHALIQVGEAPLGRIILRVASQYARKTQSRLATTGHLFENRYFPVLVDADNYFLELLRYIHLNPVRAKLVSDAELYPWSSHHAYVGTRIEPWVTTEFGLSLFASDSTRAVPAYRRFINEAVGDEDTRSPFDHLNHADSRVLGNDDFARRMLGAVWRPRSRKTLEGLLVEACARFNLDDRQLCSSSKSPGLVTARAWIAREAVEGKIASVAAVARRLNRNESSLRRAVESREQKD
jgi:REP element-mobilizing transposase RayT